MGCLLDDLGAFFVINVDQWTTAAQDKREWCKAVKQGEERFLVKLTAVVEKARARLRHAEIYPNVTGTTKERKTSS